MNDLPRVRKAYAYITRKRDGHRELLVFEHARQDAGVQVPRGTVEPGEDPAEAVVREVEEETGVTDIERVERLGRDEWPHRSKPKVYVRHFYHLPVREERDRWRHRVFGGGEDHGLVYECYWVRPEEVDLLPDMDAFIDDVFRR
jgi:putative (di)nucleoside polyphosphate hydrolase